MQKATQWVSSSFDGFGQFDLPSENVQKSKSSQKSRLNSTTDKSRLTGTNSKVQATGIKRSFESLQQKENSSVNKLFSRAETVLSRDESMPTKGQSGIIRGDTWPSRKTVSRRANKLPETDLWADKYTPKVQVSVVYFLWWKLTLIQ